MIPYFIIDAGYSVNLFLIMTLLLVYKRKRKTLCLAYISCLIFYITIELICRIPQIGVSEDISFVIAGFYEIFVTFFILCIFCQGNIWRNYTFLILDFALVNALTGYLIAFSEELVAVYDRCIIHSSLTLGEALVMGIVHVISGSAITLIMSKIIRKDYKGNGRIYMIFCMLYVILGISQLVFKRNAVSSAIDEKLGVAKVVYVIIAVVTFYLFGMLYFKLEGKRLEQENERLAKLIKENNIRYGQLMDENRKLSAVKTDYMAFEREVNSLKDINYENDIKTLAGEIDSVSLTGNIIVDSVLSKYYNLAKGEGIRCEFILCDLCISEEYVVNIATILENIMLLSINMCEMSDERWIYLSVRKNDDMLLIVNEFSKSKGQKLEYRKSILSRQSIESNRLQLIKSLCDSMSGTIDIENKKEESNIKMAIFCK